MFSKTVDGRQARGERTRRALAEAAVDSFREHGYEATTIRSLASTVGVSVGVANYHFASKADLVQELYVRVQVEHSAAATRELEGVTTLVDRLRVAMSTGLDALAPFHDVAPGFLAASMSPRSAINPLSPESVPARDIALETFRTAVAGSRTRIPAALRTVFADLAFTAYLLLALYWTYDGSPGQARTRRLLDGALGLLGAALPLLRLPGSAALVRRLVVVAEEAVPWAA